MSLERARQCRRRSVRVFLRHAFLGATMVTCLGPSLVDAQLEDPRLTPNYRDADIRLVADQVQRVIGRPIILDARVRAQVTILSSGPVSPDAFYRLFLSALETHGYVAVETGNAIQVVPKENR